MKYILKSKSFFTIEYASGGYYGQYHYSDGTRDSFMDIWTKSGNPYKTRNAVMKACEKFGEGNWC